MRKNRSGRIVFARTKDKNRTNVSKLWETQLKTRIINTSRGGGGKLFLISRSNGSILTLKRLLGVPRNACFSNREMNERNNKRLAGRWHYFQFGKFICKLRIPSTSDYKVYARVPRTRCPWLKAIRGISAIRLIPTNCRLKFHRPRILCAVKMFFMGFDARVFYGLPALARSLARSALSAQF